MRFFQSLAAVAAFCSSALALTVTSPTAGDIWDFSTPKDIRFQANPNDPPVVSIILIQPRSNWQTKLADNVNVTEGHYTTQPNPSVPNGKGYVIELTDGNGEVAHSAPFTVQKA
ncbi:hypothetical protein VTN96DRAFT_8445 [Rasamsonia emersonii]